MKLLRNTLIASTLALVMSSVASANPFVFVDGHLQGASYVRLESYGVDSYTNTWDISGQTDFSPSLTFDNAVASFWFADDLDAWQDEFVTVDLGSVSSWLNHFEVGGTIGNLGTYQLVSGNLSMTLLADIAQDGQLTYTVRADNGDFYLKETRLTVYAHVPEAGSTLALLGLAFLGLAAFGRRKKSAAA